MPSSQAAAVLQTPNHSPLLCMFSDKVFVLMWWSPIFLSARLCLYSSFVYFIRRSHGLERSWVRPTSSLDLKPHRDFFSRFPNGNHWVFHHPRAHGAIILRCSCSYSRLLYPCFHRAATLHLLVPDYVLEICSDTGMPGCQCRMNATHYVTSKYRYRCFWLQATCAFLMSPSSLIHDHVEANFKIMTWKSIKNHFYESTRINFFLELHNMHDACHRKSQL